MVWRNTQMGCGVHICQDETFRPSVRRWRDQSAPPFLDRHRSPRGQRSPWCPKTYPRSRRKWPLMAAMTVLSWPAHAHRKQSVLVWILIYRYPGPNFETHAGSIRSLARKAWLVVDWKRGPADHVNRYHRCCLLPVGPFAYREF